MDEERDRPQSADMEHFASGCKKFGAGSPPSCPATTAFGGGGIVAIDIGGGFIIPSGGEGGAALADDGFSGGGRAPRLARAGAGRGGSGEGSQLLSPAFHPVWDDRLRFFPPFSLVMGPSSKYFGASFDTPSTFVFVITEQCRGAPLVSTNPA